MRPATLARMRIGFDISAFELPCSLGVRRVARSTVEALERREHAGESALEVVRLAPPPGAALRRWRQRGLPALVASERLFGIHSFTSAFAWRGRGKRVQTIHELPWRHGADENAGLRHRAWATLGPRRADRVVCPTEHVARDLRAQPLATAGVAARTRVVSWGAGPEFADEPPPGTIDEAVLERYRLGGDPIVLCPGAVRPKKNLAATLRGVAELVRDGRRVEVVVTGGDTNGLRRDLGLASKLGIASHVTTLDAVDEADWPSLYRMAAVVPVFSTSEGFALPVLEALRCGTPVLVPADSAQSEVAGNGGTIVDPSDAQAVARALADVIERREALRYALSAEHAAKTWDATARAIADLWSELA